MLKNKKILIIDDNVELLSEIKKVLTENDSELSFLSEDLMAEFASDIEEENPVTESLKTNYEIQTETSGEEGYKIIKESIEENDPFALAIIDMKMPGWSGSKTAGEIKKIDNNIEIVLITAYDEYQRGEVLPQIGSADKIIILRKPFTTDEIRQIVLALTAKWNIEQTLKEKNIYLEDTLNETNRLKNKLNNIVSFLPSILIGLSNIGEIVHWNIQAKKWTGINLEEVEGKLLWDICPYLSTYKDIFFNTIKTKKSIKKTNEKINKGDKEDSITDITFFPLINSMDDGVIMIIEDITNKVKLENQLNQSQKMETIGNLASGLAHDFNNVLGGVTGTASLLQYMLKKKEINREKVEDYVKTIIHASNRAANMVTQLLRLSKKHEMNISSVNLNDTVNNVMKICNNTIDKSIELKTNNYKDKAMVSADASQIEQLLLNLCVNASHAMTIMRKPDESQGGTLTVSIEHIFADQNFCATHPEVTGEYYYFIRIQDTGVGMNIETLSKIYDPFFTSDKKGGTGLGLAMVYNIVRQHKGFIDVYSEVGNGSTFNIFLPKLEKEEEHEIKPEKEEIVPKGSGFILIVDDEKIILQITRTILEECGYDVLEAENGEEAIKIFKEKHMDIKVVILDMTMPKMSGKETYIELKKISPDVKVLLASGFKEDKRIKETLDLGVNGFIQKPFTMLKLAKEINNIIE